MSVFAKLFGGGKKPDNSGESIQKLRDLEDVHRRKSEYLEKKIEDELKIAKENSQKNKRGKISIFPFVFYAIAFL